MTVPLINERLFIDTVFVQALLNRRDQYHSVALQLLPRVQAAPEVWTTEAILVEVGNALSDINRDTAVRFIRQCYKPGNLHVVTIDTRLMFAATDLYASRPDKGWGLTDCLSFVTMQEKGLSLAVTNDRHFVQAGFVALLLSL